MRGPETITILCSGVALGVYVPALLVQAQLMRSGLDTEVVVLESLFTDEKQDRIVENKIAFHQSFAVARMGQRMAQDMSANLDEGRVHRLVEGWAEDDRRLFIVFSGYWTPLVQTYRQRVAPRRVWVHNLHMDADVSASWRHGMNGSDDTQSIWLFRYEPRGVDYQLYDFPETPVAFDERPDRYLIHGGGWGMGTYQSKIPGLAAAGLNLDIVAYTLEEAVPGPGQRCFMIDPQWRPWERNRADVHELPPFGKVGTKTIPHFTNRPDSHELYHLARQARAIISKPGGATVLDALATATPLVLLEPFGDYEAKNAALCIESGWGISLPEWEATGFAPDVLEPLHNNLVEAQRSVPHYVATWIPRFQEFLKETS